MKKFFFKMLILVLPFFLIFLTAILMDPFKIWGHHEEFYNNNFVTLNREMVCLELFKRNYKTVQYDSFIFGSSRSQAYKIKKWIYYLPKGSKGFHFDASGEGIYGIYNKLHYIDKSGLRIKNVLFIIDEDIMSKTKNKKGHHVFISPPELSGESSLAYYLKFLKANLNPKFVIGFFDYKIFKKYRPYMQDLFNRVVYYHVSDNMTGDLYYGYDRLITEDKEKYYSEMLSNNAFNREPGIYSHEIKPAEKMLLKQINEILIKHGTDYKIVISPLFDQIPFDVKRMELLKSIFDKRNIYDFSGKNRYTESIYNFYESGHYRPVVADSIMEKIYSIKSSGEAEY